MRVDLGMVAGNLLAPNRGSAVGASVIVGRIVPPGDLALAD